jgi:GNAT superfamily N-acetyltransferase
MSRSMAHAGHRVIRDLAPSEAPLVARFYAQAPDYWLLAEGACDPDRQAAEFFTDAPPGCDPAASHRLGLFLPEPGSAPGVGDGAEGRLSGVAELSFGFPEPRDAYLGLMLLGPWAQGAGHGKAFLAQVETLARVRGATRLLLAVLDANPRGRAFWDREGFRGTGLFRHDTDTGHRIERLLKPL